ncbi:ABC transporter permease [Bombilactobacillus bombi]|uniref:ABC transporter permease n=1 Tax=Bombilactobacillus bombi TaxID=1303590 RepID=UPI0015E60C87|nr:ABC transporter permease [Bombilactobacillus bombi]
MSIVSGFVVGAIIMLVFGYDPLQNYGNLLVGSFGGAYSIGETLRNMTPLILTALGFAVSSKAGFFNIGGSGQYLMGWFGAVVVALKWSWLPGWFLIIVSIMSGALLGGVWSAIAGLLRAYCGTSEVITTIMLNYVALYFVNFAVKNWLAAQGHDSSATITAKASLRSPLLASLTSNSTLHWGFILALLVCLIIWIYFNRTRAGFELRSIGLNERAAQYAGMNVRKTIILAMLISGILAGLGGALDGLGNFQNISVSNSLPQVGYDGMAVAILASYNPLGIILSSLLFSALQIGGMSMSVYSNAPTEIVSIVTGSIIFFIAIKYAFEIILKKYKLSYPKFNIAGK